MNRKTFLVFVCICLLALPAAPMAAAAEDPEVDEEWREERRTLDFTRLPDGNGFEAESTRESDLGDDELMVRYILDRGMLRVRYVSTEPGNESLLSLDLTALALVEFRDRNQDGGYGFGDDMVHRIPVDSMQRPRISIEPFLSGGHLATATYDLPMEQENESGPLDDPRSSLLPGHLILRFYMVPSTQTFEGSDVTPMEVKFDIELVDYPFRQPGTMVALETRFEANRVIEDAEWNERAMQVPDGFFRGYLSWTGEAEVDGQTAPVTVTTLSYVAGEESGQSRVVAFAYPAGESIKHDPEMGVLRYQAPITDIIEHLVQGNWLLYGLGLAVTVLAVGIPAGIRLRER